MSGWEFAWIVVFFVAIGVCAGAVGGYLSARHEVNRLADKIEETQKSYENSTPDFKDWSKIFGYYPGNNGNGNGSQYNGDNNNNGSSDTEGETPQVNTNKAALGIMVQDTENGVKIVDFLANTNASDSGLQKDDIITKIDNHDVASVNDLRNYLAQKDPGDIVQIIVTRNGKTQKPASVQLIDNSENASHSDFPSSNNIKG